MSFLYWLSRFSQEAMLVELFLIACVATSYFGYLLIQKRKYGVAKKNIPDHVVRAFLVELISYSEGFKNQLFGEDFKIPLNNVQQLMTNAAAPTTSASTGVDAAELNALKAALAGANAKQTELANTVAALAKEKAALEAKLAAAANAQQSTGAPSGIDPKLIGELNEKIASLESRLAEYEVIEDDLANLKKYQQENKQLRAQLDALQKGGRAPAAAPEAAPPAPLPAAAAPTPAPEPEAAPTPEAVPPQPAEPEPVAATPPPTAPPSPEASPLAAAEETAESAKAAENFEGLVDKVEESLAPDPAGASVVDPVAAAAAATPSNAAASDTIAAAAAPNPPAAAPAAKSEKSDADLLNEFERMLSS